MKLNISMTWEQAPSTGRVEITNGELLGGTIMIGTGEFTGDTFRFSNSGACKVLLSVDARIAGDNPSMVGVRDTTLPFSFVARDAADGGALALPELGVAITAEPDAWGAVAGVPVDDSQKMQVPLYSSFTKEQIEQFGPVRQREEFETERHVYGSPFMYDNLDVGNFYEIDPTKGIEFKADDGFITVQEDKPIVAVTVVGSGCVPKGYNIVEWWDDGESIDNMKNQLVKRQRVDNLNGTHPAIWSQLLFGTFPGLTFRDVAPGEVVSPVDCLKKLSSGFYEGFYLGFYENTAHFRVGPPYPTKVTIRCGCLATEDEGTNVERYPGDYAIRVVETTVVK